MKTGPGIAALLSLGLLGPALLTGCGGKAPPAAATGKYVDQPPHGGTPVALADGEYHVELVRDAATGTLSAYVLDDEMEDFVRSSSPSFELRASVAGEARTLVLAAVANPATGETVGDTAQFQAQADWLRTTGQFDGVLHGLTVRGKTLADAAFPFPAGNDHD
jgi:hypothetical protein